MFYEPPKAKEATLDDLVRKYPNHTIVEPKLDGVRAILHILHGRISIQSRHVGVDGEYGRFEQKVPHISENRFLTMYDQYCVLDGELIASGVENTLDETMSILGSSPNVAIEKQLNSSNLEFYIFDTPFWNGTDMRDMTWKNRKERLHRFWFPTSTRIKALDFEECPTNTIRTGTIQNMINKGLEGVVVKNPASKYGEKDAWLKIKRQISIDAQVTGYTMGKGKYEGTLGSMKVSVYDTNGRLQEIGSVSPGDDHRRAIMFNILRHLTSQEIHDAHIIVEITAQQWTTHNKLRHPRIVNYRPDKISPNTVSDNVVQ